MTQCSLQPTSVGAINGINQLESSSESLWNCRITNSYWACSTKCGEPLRNTSDKDILIWKNCAKIVISLWPKKLSRPTFHVSYTKWSTLTYLPKLELHLPLFDVLQVESSLSRPMIRPYLLVALPILLVSSIAISSLWQLQFDTSIPLRKNPRSFHQTNSPNINSFII